MLQFVPVHPSSAIVIRMYQLMCQDIIHAPLRVYCVFTQHHLNKNKGSLEVSGTSMPKTTLNGINTLYAKLCLHDFVTEGTKCPMASAIIAQYTG